MLTRAQTATSCIDTPLIIRIQRWNSTENCQINCLSRILTLPRTFRQGPSVVILREMELDGSWGGDFILNLSSLNIL